MGEAERTCPDCGEANPARAKFCQACGVRLEAAAPPSPDPGHLGERRVTTVVFADLSGFTAYSEAADVEDVRALAAECADALGGIVTRYGGTVDKIIGDCVMAVFGAPTSHEDDPERAVRAALDMQTYVSEHADRFARLPLSIGVNTGETIWSPVGSGGQYTVLGDVVNTASRIQGAASSGTALVGEATYQATKDVIAYEPVEPIKAKNKEELVTAWRAVGVASDASRRRSARTPFVGRRPELEQLSKVWTTARDERAAHLIWMIGPPGIGKSRIIDAVTDRLVGEAQVYSGRCLAYGEGITYWPVIGIVKEAAGILFDDADDVVSSKLGFLLESLGGDNMDELRTMAVAVANLVAAPTTPRGTYSAAEISQGELHWGVRRLFELLALRCPLVLVFEDLHWAEPTLLDLLGSLVGTSTPMLVLAAARPEIRDVETDLLTPDARRHLVELEALEADESRSLVTELLGEVPEQIADLVKASGGNPLYLEEIARVMREGVATDGKSVAELLAAGGLHGLIGSRLDRLSAAQQRVAGYASVIGDVFWPAAVSHVARSNGEVEAALEDLRERDVVEERATSAIAGEKEYGFTHSVVREVAYSRLPKAHRAQLHERCGDWVAALPGGREEYTEIVAYHLEQACRLSRDVSSTDKPPPVIAAIAALRMAARKAEKREGLREADRFYARAIDLAGDRFVEAAAELRLYRAEMTDIQGDTDRAAEEWSHVADVSQRLGRSDLRGRALLKLADVDVRHGRGAEARDRLTTSKTLAAEALDRDLEVRATVSRADFRALFEGETATAIEELHAAVSMAEELGDRALEIEARAHLGNQLYNMGDLVPADEALGRAFELAGAQGSFRDEARVSQVLGLVKFYRGDLVEAERLASRVLSWLDRSGDRFLRLQILELLGKIALVRGEFAAAVEFFREALELAEAFGSWLVVDVSRYLAEAVGRTGSVDDVAAVAAHAREALTHDDPYMQAAVLLAEGAAGLAARDVEIVRDRFEQALSLLESQDLNLDLAEARLVFARALRELGDSEAAREELRRVRELAFRLGASGLVAGAERELALADAM